MKDNLANIGWVVGLMKTIIDKDGHNVVGWNIEMEKGKEVTLFLATGEGSRAINAYVQEWLPNTVTKEHFEKYMKEPQP